MAEGKLRSVGSMPGGKDYIKTLRETWDWLSSAPHTLNDLHPWFARRRPLIGQRNVSV